MKRKRLIRGCLAGLVLLLLPAGGAVCGATHRVGAVPERDTIQAMDPFVCTLQKQIPGLMERYDVPGLIIALLQEGRIVWTDAFGYADLAFGREMTTATLCRVESLSKPVTAVGVMKLAGRGIIDLDAPVRAYMRSWEFPASGYPDGEVTVRMLLSNTSGLPLGTIGVRYAHGEERPGLREALTKDAVLSGRPGARFVYSNAGFNLLELLVEEVTGLDFSDYMEQEVLGPLGMDNSGYTLRDERPIPVPAGYDLRGNPIPVYVYPERGAGGLFSTVEDYARFLIAGMPEYAGDDRILNVNGIEAMYTPETRIGGLYGLAFPHYGLGYFIESLPGGLNAVSHGGQGSGWMTHFHAVPERGDGIIIFCNSQRSWPLFARILEAWGDWNGFGRIGMSRIIPAANGIWVLTAMLAGTSLWLFLSTLHGIWRGRRRLSLNFRPLKARRVLPGLFSLVLATILAVAASRDYLFMTSVFPVAAVWLGYALLFLSFALMFRVLFQYYENSIEKRSQIKNQIS